MIELADSIVNSKDIHMVDRNMRAKVHHIVGIVKFTGLKNTYVEIKEHLKNALIEATDKRVKAMICHNLAVINHCEL